MTVVILSLLFIFSASLGKIIQVQVLSRHCDRMPFRDIEIPRYPVNWRRKFDLEWQELTPLGIQQCFELGQNLKKRYMSPNNSPETHIEGIDDSKYHPRQFSFEATDTTRTLQSCQALGFGLFHKNKGDPLQNIAVRTISSVDNDIWLRSSRNCECYFKENFPKYYKDHAKEFRKKYEPESIKIQTFLGLVDEKTGEKSKNFVDLKDFHILYDLINCLYEHDLIDTNNEKDKEMVEKVFEINDIYKSIQFNRKTCGSLLGGPFLSLIISNMNRMIAQQSTDEGIKFHNYCGHDSSLLGVASSLFLTEDFPIFQKQPSYGSSLIFELHESPPPKDYFVKLLYLPKFDSNEYIELSNLSSLLSPSQSSLFGSTSFIKFRRKVEEKSVLSVDQFCSLCKNNRSSSKLMTCYLPPKNDPSSHEGDSESFLERVYNLLFFISHQYRDFILQYLSFPNGQNENNSQLFVFCVCGVLFGVVVHQMIVLLGFGVCWIHVYLLKVFCWIVSLSWRNICCCGFCWGKKDGMGLSPDRYFSLREFDDEVFFNSDGDISDISEYDQVIHNMNIEYGSGTD